MNYIRIIKKLKFFIEGLIFLFLNETNRLKLKKNIVSKKINHNILAKKFFLFNEKKCVFLFDRNFFLS